MSTQKPSRHIDDDAAGSDHQKRAKLSNGDETAPFFTTETDSIVNQALLREASRKALREEFTSAQPYNHCVLRDIFDAPSLALVRDEIINNIQATYKETDLFKVFQTGDLGNLARLDPEAAAKLPTLMRLKSALYSDAMRSFFRDITGCGELSDKIDCSCNVYADGGHLLCHDDVIGTRRVSWIIYLTDPDDAWTAEDGGALELYPQSAGQPHTPDVFPTVNLLPTFNTMATFTVQPGKSFHSIQEVFTSEKPRMSISGWYHAPQEPTDASKASLQQLQQLRAGEDMEGQTYEPFSGADESTELSDDDLSLLIRFVNPSYLSEDNWPKVQAKFAEDGSVQLQNFLKKNVAERLLKRVVEEDQRDGLGGGNRPRDYRVGLTDSWAAVGPPHKQRYLRYDGEAASASTAESASCGALLAQVKEQLFASGAFARLLRKFTTLGMVGQRAEVRRFRPGLDYTVAHYGILTKDPRLDVVLCLVDSSPSPPAPPSSSAAATAASSDQGPEAGSSVSEVDGGGKAAAAVSVDKAAEWDMGEVGGFEAYLLADDDKEGAAAEDTYRASEAEESGVLNVSAAANSLNLVLRDEGLMKFVKYVSYHAPSSRWDLAMECMPEDDSSDEEEQHEDAATGMGVTEALQPGARCSDS